ncbi:MAG: hemin uptake protein HemP [Paraburkholderia sp.]|uniref:hemin uptake protein HemP n=1 Tax=Paraburkholderia sp. TaxID=1926495 RepID=UPI00120DF7D9|nr:hemin uptake protein HemP [Paraburkholderia sp.]TAM00488.1 MAG: hemin uptake protein HemP [Paraburkholderia sp.]TAM28136.1 MAG: hemin uptake protein HemP [Paraburkholderia sp.]
MTGFNHSATLTLRRTSGAGSNSSGAGGPSSGLSGGPGSSLRSTAQSAAQSQPAASAQPLDSTALLQGRSHVSIVHNGEAYQLRATRLGKLILTK